MDAGALTYGRTQDAGGDRYWSDYHWWVGNPADSRRHSFLENLAPVSASGPRVLSRAACASIVSWQKSLRTFFANENGVPGFRFHGGQRA